MGGAAILATSPATAAETYRVRADQLHCVIENIDKYRSLSGSSVQIDLSICPETKLDAASFGAMLKNSAPSGRQGTPEDPLDTVITVERSELDCLIARAASLDLTDDDRVVELPVDLCQ
jgi:hypothetical protein